MEIIKPKLFTVMKHYSREQFIKDVIAGIIVAIVALPLSIALALASGVTPERGIYTAIVAGFIISLLGGSRVQIAGPTAAFATIVSGIVARQGMEGLALATVMAGILLILMGLIGFGRLLRYIPYTITTGFTAGIAVTIAIGQCKDFLGLTLRVSPIETMEKLCAYMEGIKTAHWQAALVGLVSLSILIIWPKVSSKIPGSIIAILVSGLMVKLLHMEVNTIGSLYEISNRLPSFSMPAVTLSSIGNLLPDAATIAVLAGVESLLSCVVSDGMIGSRHRSNTELVAQGLGNIASALFGGIPATGAIARTAANVKNGGRTPVAGMVHSVLLILILVVLMPYVALIPMPAIAAILFVVAYNMCGWREFLHLVKTAPKSDVVVLMVTFLLTVIFDLVIAIEIGIVLAALLFMKRMADVTHIEGWKITDDDREENENDKESIAHKIVPKHTLVYEINGPMFFAAAEQFMTISTEPNTHVIILRMRSVPAMDITALDMLRQVHERCVKNGIHLIFSHIQTQPMEMMEKTGFHLAVGIDNFCPSTDDALDHAASLEATYCKNKKG